MPSWSHTQTPLPSGVPSRPRLVRGHWSAGVFKFENPEQRSTGPISVSWLTGHAILVNRAMFNEVGGYEPSLRFTEDFDLCRRLRAKGYVILHLPELAANSYEVPTIDLFARKTLPGTLGGHSERTTQKPPTCERFGCSRRPTLLDLA